jgi:hypothetical protein
VATTTESSFNNETNTAQQNEKHSYENETQHPQQNQPQFGTRGRLGVRKRLCDKHQHQRPDEANDKR